MAVAKVMRQYKSLVKAKLFLSLVHQRMITTNIKYGTGDNLKPLIPAFLVSELFFNDPPVFLFC